MALSSREIINRAILDAIAEARSVGLLTPGDSAHPRRYLIAQDARQISMWAYCWMLTPGGRPSLPNEYRIQMTSVQSPLPINPDGYTVLLGYEPNRNVFAGYDLARHTTFTSGSPSVQVNIQTLNNAMQNGLALETKSNEEIVVGIRSDLLMFYSQYAADLHELGEDSASLEFVKRASELEEIVGDDISNLSQQRQLIVRETSRWSRSVSFRRQVLSAYENRCAVTRRQLRLVDAAHILPVSSGARSVDDVRNGIALSPTYHRAFDNGLIYLDNSDQGIVMRLNSNAADELMRLGLAGGVDEFESTLGSVHLPFNPQQRPDPYFIRLANEYRGLE